MKTTVIPVLAPLAPALLHARLRDFSRNFKRVASFAVSAVFLVAWLATPSMAQTTAPPVLATTAPADAGSFGRLNQTIERIRTEDGSVRIDELRVGGETQSITVQPKGSDGDSISTALPAYEIKSVDGARGTPPPDARSGSGTGTSGARVWNVFKF